MGQLINITRQPETLQAFQLTTSDDMVTTLNFLQPQGYSGNLSMSAEGVWEMWFQNLSQNTSWNAKLTDWVIIKNGTIASAVTNDQAVVLYAAAP